MSKSTRAERHARIQSRAHALAGTRRAVQAADGAAEGEGGTSGSSAELWLYGVVGGWWRGFSAASVAEALRGVDVDELVVRLHSPGGDAIDGIAVSNLLRNHKARVKIVVDGLAASAASVIALAGDEVVMSPGAQLMIHDPWMFTMGNAAELRDDADFLDKQADNYAGIYAARASSGSREDWRAVMLADTWYTAEEAVEAGLADRVGTVTATTTAPAPPAAEPEDADAEARAAWDLEVLVHPAARAAWRDSGTPKPPSASAVGSVNTQEGESAVAFTAEQLTQMRKDLGLKADADEATIVAALSEVASESEPSGFTPPEGMTLVETAVLDDLRQGAAAGRSAREQLDAQARDTAIQAAIAAGKTTPARREHWVAAWDADPEGARAQLDALAPGLAVPTAEVGHSTEPALGEALNIDDAELDAWAASLGLTKEDLRG